MQVKHLLSGLVFIVLAIICGVFIAIWIFKHFNIYIPLENQKSVLICKSLYKLRLKFMMP
ncbi:hypothetical protein MF4642_15145 [Acinetobacter sp. MF4642]|nr:hypothetical protein MF4642_15145 [Acinetobacter sp. MF4642]